MVILGNVLVYRQAQLITHYSNRSADVERWSCRRQADYTAAIIARDAAQAATIRKDETQAPLEAACREIGRRIKADGRVTDASRERAGLPIHKTTRTPVAVPKTAPRGEVIATDRFEHTVTVFSDILPDRQAVVAALNDYDAVCLMRERTSFGKDVIDQLPAGIKALWPADVCARVAKRGA